MKRTLLFPTVSIAAMALAGCATGVDLVKQGSVSLEKVHSEKVRVTLVSVFQDGPQLRVSGRVWRRRAFQGHARGHVDVEVVGPDGRRLSHATSPGLYVRGVLRNRTPMKETFVVLMTVSPPPGSVICVGYRPGHHKPDDCRARTSDKNSTWSSETLVKEIDHV